MSPSDEFAAKYGIVEGIFDDVSDEEYHYGKYRKLLSSTGLRELQKSAAHFKAWRDRETEPPKPQFIFGKAYHIYILENKSFNERIAVAPKVDKRTKIGKEEWAEFEEKNQGKTILSEDELKAIKAMGEAMSLNKSAIAVLKNPGTFERTYIWRDPAYGIWCKCRTDLVIDNIQVIVDLKSTVNASPFGFPKSAANFGYDIQASHYVQGVNYLTGGNYKFVFLAQEKEPPYAPCVFQIDEMAIMGASEKIEPLKQALGKAFRTGEYEGYPDEVIPLQLPAWYK